MHTLLEFFLKKNIFVRQSFVHFSSSYTCETCQNAFGRGDNLMRHHITCHLLPFPACRPSATSVTITSQESQICLNTCWWSMEPALPLQILQERYLVMLMARKRISFAICYITFKTRFSFKEHMRSGAPVLAPGPSGFQGGVFRGIHVAG